MGSISRILALWGLTTYGQRLAKFLAFRRLLPNESQILRRSTPPELPEDILICIFATLETLDLVRAGSVCSSWHSAYNRLCNLGLFRQSQTPCLLYTSESAGESVAYLYSLTEKKSYTLTLPDPPIRSRYVIGSNHGWIITADSTSELYLVNPITGDQIALPSVSTIEQVKPIYDDAGSIHKYEYSWYTGTPQNGDYPSPSMFSLGVLRSYLFVKAFLSSDPSIGDYFVVLIHNPRSQLSFARAGDYKWTWLPPCVDYVDCFFKDGLLFALNSFGVVRAFDLRGPAVTQKIVVGKVKDIMSENMYIAQAPCGDCLQIWRSTTCVDGEDEHVSEQEPQDGEDVSGLEPEDGEVEDGLEPEDLELVTNEWSSESHLELVTKKIEVFKVDFAAKRLEDISSSCDNVLFLGHNQSLCLSADAYPQLKSNHVYFTDDDSFYLFGWKKSRRDIGVLNLENSTVEEIASPQLWSNWPAPVWVIPNPRKMNSASYD